MITTDLFLLNSASVTEASLAPLPDLLSSDEREIWQGLSHPERRREYLLSRALLRMLLAERLQQSATSLHFCQDKHGKPRLHNQAWHFNLSHSGPWLALALSRETSLGIDIELGLRRRSPLPLARRFYAESEYEWLITLPEAEQEGAFYRLWSRKEAVLKAHGGGIAAGLEKIRFIPEQNWFLDNQLDRCGYQVQDWPFATGWLTLATTRATTVNCYRLDARLNSIAIIPTLLHTLAEESAS